MAATTEQKVDYLLKKIGYVASKTGIAEDENSLSGTKKAPFAEAIPSPLVTPSTSIWADATLIPATPPGSDTSYVRVYLTGTSGVRMTVDNTVSGNRTFLARSTYGNDSSAILGDWIDPSFGADYIIKVFKGDPNSGGVQLSAAGAGSNDTWFFDYSSGVLNFNGTQIPSGVNSGNIYIVGYRYIGAKGGRPAAGIATFASLDVSGISTFRDDVNFISANGNNILFDKSDNALEFGDSVKSTFGNDSDMMIYHDGSHSHILDNGTGDLRLTTNGGKIDFQKIGGEVLARFYTDGANELYYDGTKRFETTSTGAQVTGDLNVTGVLTYDDVTNIDSLGIVTARTGVDVNAGGINVDGGGLNIVGVSTFASNIDANGDLDVDGHTNLDNVSIAGVTTITNSGGLGDFKAIELEKSGTTGASRINFLENGTVRGGLTYSHDNNRIEIICENGESIRFQDKGNNQFGSINSSGLTLNGDLDVDGQTDLDHVAVAGVSTFTGNIDANGDLDVDGHTELDNVNISGLTTAALLNVNNLTDGRVTYASAGGRLVDSANLTFDGTNLTAASAKITDLTSGRVVTAGTNGALQDSANLTFNGSLLDVTGNLAVSGNVSIAGTLTYQDVTNIDSVGIATARVGLKVLAGGVEIDGGGLDVQAGVSTFAGNIDANGDLDVDGHTELDNVNIAGVTTFAGAADFNSSIDVDGHTELDNVNISGITTFASTTQSTSTTTGAVQIAGGVGVVKNLNVGGHVDLTDSGRLNLGSGDDIQFYHNGSGSFLDLYTNNLKFRTHNGIELIAEFKLNNSVDLYYDGTKRFETKNNGAQVNGTTLVIRGGSGEDSILQFISNNSASYNDHYNFRVNATGAFALETEVSAGNFENLITATQNGAVELYHNNNLRAETINSGLNVYGPTAAGVYLKSQGGTNYGYLYASATGVYVAHGTGENIVHGVANGKTDIFYDNSIKLSTSGIGVTVTGETKTTTLNVTGITTTNNLNVTGTATIASIGSTVGVSSNFYFADDKKLYFGNDQDLELYYQTSGVAGAYLQTGNASGNLTIRNTDAGQYVYIHGDNVHLRSTTGNETFLQAQHNGAVSLWYDYQKKIETKIYGVDVTGTTTTDGLVNAGVSTFVGIITASQAQNIIPFYYDNVGQLPSASAYHGAFAHVHSTGRAYFAHAGWKELVNKEADGRVGTGTETYNIKDLNVVGVSTFNNHVNLLDNDQLRIGTSADLGLYHDGSNSYIVDSGTGNLYIRGANVEIGTVGGNKYFVGASSVSKIYHLNAEKFTTKIWGVEITGTTDMDGLVVSGVSTFAGGSFSGNISAVDGTFSGNVSIAGTLTYQDVTNIDSVGIVTARTDLHVGTGATVIKTVNGQVGINSTIPAHMLDVGGVINSSTDVRVNNESLVTQNQALNDAVAMAIALG